MARRVFRKDEISTIIRDGMCVGENARFLAHYWLVIDDATDCADWFYVATGGLTHSTRWDTPSGSFTYAAPCPLQRLRFLDASSQTAAKAASDAPYPATLPPPAPPPAGCSYRKISDQLLSLPLLPPFLSSVTSRVHLPSVLWLSTRESSPSGRYVPANGAVPDVTAVAASSSSVVLLKFLPPPPTSVNNSIR